MYGSLDISTSGMIAQRTRLEVITSNLVNKDTLVDAQGRYNPYRPKSAVFMPGDPSATSAGGRGMGVHVSSIETHQDALRPEYQPGSPFADERGYVMAPDIDPVVQQINATEALRAYEANVTAAEATKTMLAQMLRLVA